MKKIPNKAFVTFGLNVKKYRILKKLTQEQLAESIATSAVQIGRIESGSNACTIQMVLKLCIALGVTPNDLFNNIEGIPTTTDTVVYLNNYISSHKIRSGETKNFLKYILDYFEKK
ncbi:MAG: helix-turn-helix transcriptional regulator [Clostridia bacterium]